MPVSQVPLNHRITRCLRTSEQHICTYKEAEPNLQGGKGQADSIKCLGKREEGRSMGSQCPHLSAENQSGLVHRKSHGQILCFSIVFFLLKVIKSDDSLKFFSFCQVLPIATKRGNNANSHTKILLTVTSKLQDILLRIYIKRLTNL